MTCINGAGCPFISKWIPSDVINKGDMIYLNNKVAIILNWKCNKVKNIVMFLF